MTSITPRIIITALAILALAVPAASAMPLRDNAGVRTSSLAGTTSAPEQDLRNPDNRAPQVVPPAPAAPAAPAPAQPVAVDDGGTSPLVYIIPGLVLVAMLGVGVAYARMPRRSPA